MEGARVTSVISNQCIRTLLLFLKFSNVGVGVAECYLQIFCRDVGLQDRRRVRGLGLRPFVVYPPSCRGGRFVCLLY